MLKWIGGLLLLVVVAIELFARYYLGLGDPPLMQADPTIEYLFKPNQDVRRFGNHFFTNRYGMRSDDFPPHKSRPGELRVMVFGDSVVNGGGLTDHARLATTLLQEKLARELRRPVIVGNISAGSWGPPNQLAYARQFGFFDADVVVLVQSSDDYSDVPTFAPLDPETNPTQKPWCAACEGLTRYLPRYLSHTGAGDPAPAPAVKPVEPRDVETALAAEREFFNAAKTAGSTAILVQHWTRHELAASRADAGHAAIRQVAAGLGVPAHDDADDLRRGQSEGRDPFRDDIHPNDSGQAALEAALFEALQADAAALIATKSDN